MLLSMEVPFSRASFTSTNPRPKDTRPHRSMEHDQVPNGGNPGRTKFANMFLEVEMLTLIVT